ncbi:MAG: VCBS repeat-containing protein, partial [Myxococcales bacterium]|nr:VCBS repeat-containing protein [Myxococcales bacterium]
ARAVVGAAIMAAVGDLTSDPGHELVVADATRLRVVTRAGDEVASRPAPAGVQVLTTADLDGDGSAEILAGFGRTREHPEGAARAAVYRLRDGALHEELLIAPETERAEIAAIVPWPRAGRVDLLVAHFDSRFFVTVSRARFASGAWELAPVAQLRMATSYALGDLDGDGALEVVVGRVYGDSQPEEGDAFVLLEGGARRPIPTTRGVRGLAVLDTDGDGRAEVFLGDGWHRNYGQLARGQLTVARQGDDGFSSETVLQMPGQYTLWQIVPADLYGDGSATFVARASTEVYVLRRDASGWSSARVGGEARHVAVGDLDGRPGDEVVLLTDPPEILSFR